MSDSFELGPISVKKGTKGYGTLPVTTMASGYEIAVPVHIIAGSQPGPTVTVIPMLHGHEFTVLEIVREILEHIDPQELTGNLVATTVTNPAAFQMGTRASWFDGLWGPINDLNRAFPGNPRGWIVERIAHVIAENIIPISDIVIDFHGESTHRYGAGYYAYHFNVPGSLGKKTTEFTYDMGLEIVVNFTHVWNGSLLGYCQSQGKIGLAAEVCDFFGLEGDPINLQPKRTAMEAGVTCVKNVLKKQGMINGQLKLPKRQMVLDGYVGIAPAHGGLLCPEVTRNDIGRVFQKDQHLGTVINPYTFELLDKLQMPYEKTVILEVKDAVPFSHIEPGASDVGFGVGDGGTISWRTH